MLSLVARFGLAATVLAIGGGLTACGNGSSITGPSSSQTAGALIPAQASSAVYGLGFVAADPATVASLSQIRHSLSVTPLPAAVDLSAKMPPVGNQGQEGSCVSWASAYALRGYEARQDVWSSIAPKSTDPALNFSPAFVYNQVNGGHDGGSTVPAVLGLLQQRGAATLADMPYFAGQFTTQPSGAALADAQHYKLGAYGYIAPTDLTSMKAQVAAGIPVIVAISVYNSFFKLGANQIYNSLSGGYAGGHAITIVGYDDSRQAVLVMNSWGTGWGTAGFGWIAYPTLSLMALEAYSAIDDRGAPPNPNARPSTPAPIRTAAPAPPKPPPATPKPTAPPATPKPAPQPTAKPSATATPKH